MSMEGKRDTILRDGATWYYKVLRDKLSDGDWVKFLELFYGGVSKFLFVFQESSEEQEFSQAPYKAPLTELAQHR